MLDFTLTDEGKKTGYGLSGIVGVLPHFFQQTWMVPAAEQLRKMYVGGWMPMDGWTYDPKDHSIRYPGDPKHKPLASATLREEKLFVYESAWVCIVQPDGSFEVSRCD
jgi:hypothetical protein